jgi:hypothetical protein
MASFADEDKINLGEIGEWNIATLEEMSEKSPRFIEDLFASRIRKYDNMIKELETYKVVFSTLEDIMIRIESVKILRMNRTNMISCLHNYHILFPRVCKEKEISGE